MKSGCDYFWIYKIETETDDNVSTDTGIVIGNNLAEATKNIEEVFDGAAVLKLTIFEGNLCQGVIGFDELREAMCVLEE